MIRHGVMPTNASAPVTSVADAVEPAASMPRLATRTRLEATTVSPLVPLTGESSRADHNARECAGFCITSGPLQQAVPLAYGPSNSSSTKSRTLVGLQPSACRAFSSEKVRVEVILPRARRLKGI